MSVIVPYVCSVSSIWFEYPELLLLLRIDSMCSLHLTWNVRPVCPVQCNEQSRYLITYIPLLLICLYAILVLRFSLLSFVYEKLFSSVYPGITL
jgi:hypothetical protein